MEKNSQLQDREETEARLEKNQQLLTFIQIVKNLGISL